MSEFCLILIILLSVIALITVFIFNATFHPDRDAEKALSRLSNRYYTEYLYPRFVSDDTQNPADILSVYSEKGIPAIHLRQLLSFDSDALKEKKYLINAYYTCDEDSTSARFYPVPPYGVKDYRIEYSYSCKFL